MSKNNKGMVCLLNRWEWVTRGIGGEKPDCRNHRHISRRRLYERSGDARFADELLARVYDAQDQLLGFIVVVAKQARWADHVGNLGCQVRIDPTGWKLISAELDRFQTVIDAGQSSPGFVKLSDWSGLKPGISGIKN
jgi:hypothetical protein